MARLTKDQQAHIAKELDAYVRFRAAREGVGYELGADFFWVGLERGCVEFFGVTFDRNGLTGDQQFPAWFEEWTNRKTIN